MADHGDAPSVPCKNAAVCDAEEAAPHLQHKGICINCDMFFGKALDFVAAHLACPVCLNEVATGIKFPGCPAGHMFCVACFKSLRMPALTCDGRCGYTSEELEEQEMFEGVERDALPERRSSDCDGECFSPKRVEACPLCRAAVEDAKQHWGK